jgi:hypothetical protein
MHRLIKIICYILIIILGLIIISRIKENIKLNKILNDNINDKFINGSTENRIINYSNHNDKKNNNKYLTMSEIDFDKLNINDRWIYRSLCLNKFNEFLDDYSVKQFKYPLPKSEKNGLIFINLASYRDSECHKTIKSLIYNCTNWKNLRIVICEQNSEEDIPFNYNLDPIYKNIIQVIRMSYKNARGPTLARFLIQQRYSGEEYYMQIDSHTLFEKNWDYKLINTIKNLPPKSCLTQYLPDYEIGSFKTKPKLRAHLKVSKICSLDGFTRINAQYVNPNINYDSPFKSNGWSGCFSFSSGDICYDAIIDPYTPDVFFGEEMDICLRLFTRGWDFYAPHYPVAYTNFNRSYRETFWEKKGLGYNKNITLCSRLRIHYRLGTLPNHLRTEIENKYPQLLIEVNKFTLGNERTLKDYENLIKFNFNDEK